MTPSELASRLEALSAALLGELRTELETVAESGKALVIQRVSETGKDAKGAKFKPYTRPYELRKRAATGNVKKEGKKKRAARRSAEASAEKPVGRYRGFVDFTLTGRMLSNIGLVEQKDAGNRVVVRVGGRSEETKKKMEGNDKHRPGWFSLSKQEVESLKEQSAVRVSAIITRFLNS